MGEIDTRTIDEKIPLKSKIWISAADGGVALLQGIIGGGALTYYFTKIRGLNSELAAIVWLIFGIWNAINDPLFGYITDRTKTKLGRRIPYIRYGAPLLTLFYCLSWVIWPGSEGNQTNLFIQLLVFLFFYDILYTAVATAIWIMPFEIAISNKARGSVFVWKILFSIVAIVIPLIAVPLLQPDVGDSPEIIASYQMFNYALAIIVGLICYISTYFYKEHGYNQEEEMFSIVESFKASFRNKPFWIFEILSFTIIYVQTGLMQGVLYYYDEINISMLFTFGALFIGAIFGLIVYIKKHDVWGVKGCMMLMMGVFAISCLLLLLFGKILIFAVISFFGVGMGFAGGYYLIPMMMGDTYDYDEHLTGKRREGMYSGINSLVTKPAISIAQAVFLTIIAAFGYIQDLPKGAQSASAETGILVGWMLIPFILTLCCVIALKWYSLHGKEWNDIKIKLAIIHEEKERKFIEKFKKE